MLSNMQENNQPLIVIKYGGNAMSSDDLKRSVVEQICALRDNGFKVVVVHGGGPFIGETLDMAKIESEFIDGHRRTTPEALKYVKMALKGQVNADLVALFEHIGCKAVGLSGVDGGIVKAKKRTHTVGEGENRKEHDLGQVGDVEVVNTELIELLLNDGYMPVITCLATDEKGDEYNINADMFAGHIAGALKASEYIVLTDVDGLMRDIDDPGSLIERLSLDQIEELVQDGVIKGGMIPKIESCEIAINKGAGKARIINGTSPDQLRSLKDSDKIGTQIQ